MSPSSSALIYLASASPRRHELLTQIGVPHEVLHVPAPPGEDEPRLANECAADYVLRTATEKALRAHHWLHDQGLPLRPLLTADTSVIVAEQILNKPADREAALHTLRTLSGRSHEVRTAVVLWTAQGDRHSAVSISTVTLRELSDDDIARYCDSGEPYGKAGAYGIQGLAGIFVSHLAGSYTGVMGLPVFETANLLRQAGIILP